MGRRGMAALGLAVLALSGCSALDAGEAAVSDEFRISQADVDSELRLVLEALGQPSGEPPVGWATATTQRLVQDELFAAKAAELGIDVTPGEVQAGLEEFAALQGGREALEQAALQSAIPTQSLETVVRTQLLWVAIGQSLDPAADPSAQTDLARAALAEYSEQIDIEVAPRYGTWDDQALQIVPGSSVVEGPAQSLGG